MTNWFTDAQWAPVPAAWQITQIFCSAAVQELFREKCLTLVQTFRVWQAGNEQKWMPGGKRKSPSIPSTVNPCVYRLARGHCPVCAAPRGLPSSPAPSKASSVLPSSTMSNYDLMISEASLPAKAPLATLDFNAAAAKFSIARAAPSETLHLSFTRSASSSQAGRTQRPSGKATARSSASSSPVPATVVPLASPAAGSATATPGLPAASAIPCNQAAGFNCFVLLLNR